MAVLVAREGGLDIEPGAYTVTCRAADEDHGQYGAQIKFEFELDDVTDADGAPEKLVAWASAKLTPSSKLWGWCEAFGFKPEIGKPFDTEDLVGAQAQAIVVQRPGSNGGTVTKVDQIVPLPRRGGRKQDEPEDTHAFLSMTPEGEPSVDWSKFWAIGARHGIRPNHVLAEAGVEAKEKIDPFELPAILERLIERVKA